VWWEGKTVVANCEQWKIYVDVQGQEFTIPPWMNLLPAPGGDGFLLPRS
jgi:hypothetical protein